MFRVLIVDDDSVDREVAAAALDRLEGEVLIGQAADGNTALDILDAEAFDCLILDYRLPDYDGIQFLEKLSHESDRSAMPVIMLTGEGNENVAVSAMKHGVFDYLPKGDFSDDSLARAVRNAIRSAALQRQLEDANAKVKEMAYVDSLTGLGNRNMFNNQLEHVLAVSARQKQPFSLLLLDLNRFKEINDTLGHLAGDRVLAEVGNRLKALSRSADLIFRLGGDEFAFLLETGATLEGAKVLADKIIEAVNRPIDIGDETRSVGVSIGISLYPDNGTDRDRLINRADAAMYGAKRQGGGYAFA